MNAFYRVTLNKFKFIASLIAIGYSMCSPAAVLAAPAITSVAGTVGNGETITITGTGFGSTGPTIVVFDDFEKGSNGTTLSSVQRAAQVGFWDNLSATMGPLYPTYSNTYAHSGSLSMKSDWSDNGAQEGGRLVQANLGGATQVYASWWMYLPANRNVPGTAIGAPNWKIFWIYANPWPASDYVCTFLDNVNSGYLSCGVCDDQNAPLRADFGPVADTLTTATSFAKGTWMRYEVYLVGSSTSGVINWWETSASRTRIQRANKTGVNTMHTGEPWVYFHLPGYGRGDAGSQTYYDDAYIAKGPGALARVEIGNNATYSNCTNLAVITPTSWSSNSITATVRQGGFTAGAPAYLFVVDSSGAVSPGYPVTIGSGGGTPAPATVSAPTGFRIITN